MGGRPNFHPPVPGSKFRPPQMKNQQNMPNPRYTKAYMVAMPKANASGQSTPGRRVPVNPNACFNCGKLGHFSKNCPEPRKQYGGRVHYTTVEEVPEGEPVTAGTFLVNKIPAVILFDTGSLHSFISLAFAQKHEFKISKLEYGYKISSVGSDVSTR